VITTAPKAKPKPSAQTRLVLDAMESDAKREEARFEQIQKAVELLVVKLEAQEEMQHQVAAQMALMTQAVAQLTKEQVALSQQVASTSELVAHLMVDHRKDDIRDGRVGFHRGHNWSI
jgi:hypothetical protein